MSQQGVFKNQYSKYYNLFYAEKNYELEVNYINSTIKKWNPSALKVLEFGSGTGGHGLLLQKYGYEIFGVELSAEMASIAVQKGYKCRVGNMIDVSIDDTFDVVIALFHVISYVNANADLLQLFRNSRKHLNPGGIFLFDVWFTPAVIHQMPEVRVKKADGTIVIWSGSNASSMVGFWMVENAQNRNAFTDKSYMSPVGQSQIIQYEEKGFKLTQTTGW